MRVDNACEHSKCWEVAIHGVSSLSVIAVVFVVVVDAVVLGGGAGLLYREGNFFKGLRVSDNSLEGFPAGAKPPEDLSSIRSHFGSLVTCYQRILKCFKLHFLLSARYGHWHKDKVSCGESVWMWSFSRCLGSLTAVHDSFWECV